MNPMSNTARNKGIGTSFRTNEWTAIAKRTWLLAAFSVVVLPFFWAAWLLFKTSNGWYLAVMVLFVTVFPWQWVWDIVAGIYHPKIHRMALPPTETCRLSFWHISPDLSHKFEGGIRFDLATSIFLGNGFYTWASIQDCAQAAAKHPATIVYLTILPTQWAPLSVREVPSKWSWQYVALSYLWVAQKLLPRTLHQAWMSPCLRRLLGDSDVVIAPAIGMAWKSRQVLWRDTPQCREVLQNAHIDFIPRLPQAR